MTVNLRRLARLRWKTTERCVLRASLRGKRHVQAREEAWHHAIAERVAKDCPLHVEEEGQP